MNGGQIGVRELGADVLMTGEDTGPRETERDLMMGAEPGAPPAKRKKWEEAA